MNKNTLITLFGFLLISCYPQKEKRADNPQKLAQTKNQSKSKLNPLRSEKTDGFSELFSNQIRFSCSPLPEVGCKGLFAAREGEGHQVKLIIGAKQNLAERIRLMRSATEKLYIQSLIWRSDEVGYYLAEIAREKALEGVDVRIIVDNLLTTPEDRDYYDSLRQDGVKVLGYQDTIPFFFNEFFGNIKGNALYRYHEKLTLVDPGLPHGAVILGGSNIGNEYFRLLDSPEMKWTDQDMILKGPALSDMEEMFIRNFHYFDYLERSNYHYQGGDIWNSSTTLEYKEDDYYSANSYSAEILNKITMAEATPITGRYTTPTALRVLQQRPRINELYIQEALLHLINASNREIILVSAYLLLTEDLRIALRNAAKRGVEVKLITNSLKSNNHPIVTTVGRYYYYSLLSVNSDAEAIHSGGEIRLFEWIGPDIGEGTLHSKWGVFDRRYSWIGSYNLDPRSKYLNSENVLLLDDEEFAFELLDVTYNHHLAYSQSYEFGPFEKVREILPDEAYRFYRPEFFEQIKLWILRLLEDQL